MGKNILKIQKKNSFTSKYFGILKTLKIQSQNLIKKWKKENALLCLLFLFLYFKNDFKEFKFIKSLKIEETLIDLYNNDDFVKINLEKLKNWEKDEITEFEKFVLINTADLGDDLFN